VAAILLTLFAHTAGALGYPRRAVVFPVGTHFLDESDGLSPAEIAKLGEYGMIVNQVRPEYMDSIRVHFPNVEALFNMTFHGVPDDPERSDDDYEAPGYTPPFSLADTTYSPIRMLQYAYWKNLQEGVDWAYHDTTGAYCLVYNNRILNWTDECPLGEWGPSTGKTFREYATQVFVDRLNRAAFADYWDGYFFDSLPPNCCYIESLRFVDYDDDGSPDGCFQSGLTCDTARDSGQSPWQEQEAANTEAFISALIAAKGANQKIVVGQDWVRTASRPHIDGWKIENIGNQPGGDRYDNEWIYWWLGDDWDQLPDSNFTHGYYQAEQDLDNGWDDTFIDAVARNNQSAEQKHQWVRFWLGTSMLGDGWFNTELEGLQERYEIDEETDWAMESAVGPFYTVYDENNLSATQWRRKFLRANGDSAIIVVDPLNQDAYKYQQGACLVDGGCTFTWEETCDELGGTFEGEGTRCGACCDDETCTITSNVNCNFTGGTFRGVDEPCLAVEDVSPTPGVSGYIHKAGSNYTVYTATPNVIGWSINGINQTEDNGFLSFDTNGLFPSGTAIASVELSFEVLTQSTWQPTTVQWKFYAGTFIGTSLNSSDWTGGTLAATQSWSGGPSASTIDLGSVGVSSLNLSGKTDVRIDDTSGVPGGNHTWGSTIWKCKLIVTPDYCLGETLAPRQVEQIIQTPVTRAKFDLRVAPEPVTNELNVTLALPTAGKASVKLVDAQGRRVATIADRTWSAGEHTVQWAVPRDAMAAGVYFVIATNGEDQSIRRMTILR